MADVPRLSPLAHTTPQTFGDGAVTLAERPFMGKLILRGKPDVLCADWAAGVQPDAERYDHWRLGGIAIPRHANRAVDNAFGPALWLGPDEWMLITEPDGEAALADSISEAAGDTHHQLVDVTDYYTVIEATGPGVRHLLARFTTIDLHPRALKSGDVVGTNIGHGPAVLYARVNMDEASDFLILVRWSMAASLWGQLEDGCGLMGLAPA